MKTEGRGGGFIDFGEGGECGGSEEERRKCRKKMWRSMSRRVPRDVSR